MSEREKLTLQDCYKYPNAKIKGKECFGSIESFSIKSTIEWYRGDKNLDISEYKVVLRSIDKLKEEEKDTIDNITMYDKELLELGTIVDYRHYSIAVMDYLRSINIDIDGFIDNGKAVKK